ncbi:MAG: fumarylacetoacetate hydrolase family protein [Sodalis sp. (in: enterobacteria)]|uniref:fumarylacetoacetate hydrolase family protein n=1 Tax=Sodalis sp. (in: enterobacteria) TaxID=1898979 RepID=UPI0039E28836
MYQHRNWQGALLDFPVSKVVCVGSNYRNHIKEMGSATPSEAVLFIKSETALCDIRQPIAIPTDRGEVHHEVELAILIGAPLKQANEQQVSQGIAGVGGALDLTLRDLQAQFKKAGQPWEKAKGFDGACPISGFIPVAEFGDPQQADLTLTVNDLVRQTGNTRDMIHPILPLIAYMSRFFTLRPGDIVLTGTLEGVAALKPGDALTLSLNQHQLSTRII